MIAAITSHRAIVVALATLVAVAGMILLIPAPPADAADCGACEGKGVEKCDGCRGHGKIRCAVCSGRGKVSCQTCKDGKPTCARCATSQRRGKVWVPEQIVENPRLRTGNAPGGQVRKVLGKWRIKAHWGDCPACDGGKLKCIACRDNGRRTCAACEGTKKDACARCTGVGWLPDPCKRCKGSGIEGGPIAAPPVPGGPPGSGSAGTPGGTGRPGATPTPGRRRPGATPAPTPRRPGAPPPPSPEQADAVTGLTWGLGSEVRLLRLLAVQGLGRMPTGDAVSGLTEAAGADDVLVQRFALALLAQRRDRELLDIGGRGLVELLIDALEHEHVDARRHARRALTTIAGEDLGPKASDWYRWSTKALRGIPKKPTRPEPTAPRRTAPAGATPAPEAPPEATNGRKGSSRRRTGKTVERDDEGAFRTAIGAELHDAIVTAEKAGTDVMIALDATESMGRVFPSLTASVESASRLATGLVPNFRIGLITYGDRVTGHLDPQEDASRLIGTMRRLEAKGGGTVPEGVDRALGFLQGSVRWRRDANRVAIVIGDAAPKARDCYRAYDAAKKARRKGITIHAIVCSGGRSGEVDATSFFNNVVKVGKGERIAYGAGGTKLFDVIAKAAFSNPEHVTQLRTLAAELERLLK